MKYHFNSSGDVNICSATTGKCPFTDHYSTVLEARKAFESQNSSFGVVPLTDKEFQKILKKAKIVTKWPKEISDFLKKYPDVRFPSAPSKTVAKHQMLNILFSIKGKGLNREMLERIGRKLGFHGGDSIQWVNKLEQNGLKLSKAGSGKNIYYGIVSLQYTDKYLKTKINTTTSKGKEESEKKMRKFFHDLGNDDYEIGHKDPRLPLSDSNMVMQPSEINRSYRDNYIFDKNGLPRVPNPDVFEKDPKKFYPSKEDRRKIFEVLKKEFDDAY